MFLSVPSNIITAFLKSITQNPSFSMHYLRKKKKLTLQMKDGYRPVSCEYLHMPKFNSRFKHNENYKMLEIVSLFLHLQT